MKKILSIFILIGLLSNFQITNGNYYDTCFVVTAYYSPLPNQEYYNRQNYADEIRLNGRGTHGASGKQVFPGMLAGPISKYPFGTKIELEGIGIGEVSDIGQAIVEKGNRGYTCDRIDIWVGHGDEGLKKAMAWGKRTISGKVVDSTSKTTINLNLFKYPSNINNSLNNNPNFNGDSNFKIKTLDKNINNSSNKNDIIYLQTFLSEAGLYRGEITGDYEDINDVIVYYQLYHGIIQSKDDLGAGYVGPRTRLFLNEDYAILKNEIDKITQTQNNLEKRINEIKQNIQTSVNKIVEQIDVKKENKTPKEIILIQALLKINGYYNGELNGKFDLETKKSLIAYQIKDNVILNENAYGAGVFGPKTKAQIRVYTINRMEKLILNTDKLATIK